MRMTEKIQKALAASAKTVGKLLAVVLKLVVTLPVIILAVIFSGDDNPVSGLFKGLTETGSKYKKVKIRLSKKDNGFGFTFHSETRVSNETGESEENHSPRTPALGK